VSWSQYGALDGQSPLETQPQWSDLNDEQNPLQHCSLDVHESA
jgi:hypothetical protein